MSLQADDMYDKGMNGLTARDVKLVVDAGYHTVESVAYTYAALYLPTTYLPNMVLSLGLIRTDHLFCQQTQTNAGAD